MTMPHPHPDDERLAAYAGGDPDLLGDAALVAHLNTCDRCRELVDQLAMLRGALGELPDVAPHRPLRLIPPVPAPAGAAAGSWLRRLTAPAMAAGAAMILVGGIGIGATGAIGGFFGQAAMAVFQNVGDNLQGVGAPAAQATAPENGYGPGVGEKDSPTPSSGDTRNDSGGLSERPTPRFSPAASPTSSESGEDANHEPGDEQPWLTLLIAGTGLFVISSALRFSLGPRAG